MQFNQFWHLLTYMDYARHPFATYQTTHPSKAITAAAQLEYLPSRNTVFIIRYKFRQRPQDNKQDQLDHKQQHALKIQMRYIIWKVFAMTSAADFTRVSQPDKANTCGWMLSHKATAAVAVVCHSVFNGKSDDTCLMCQRHRCPLAVIVT